jgi:hypothetical protein
METFKKGLWTGGLIVVGMLISILIQDGPNEAYSATGDGRYQLELPYIGATNEFYVIDTLTGSVKKFDMNRNQQSQLYKF